MKKQNWFQELWTRWFCHSSPEFFVKAIKMGTACIGIGTAMLLLTATPHIVLPVWFVPIASHLMVGGTIVVAVAKATTTTPEKLPNNQPTNQ